MSVKGQKTETQAISWRKAINLLELMKDKGDDNTRLMLSCGFYLGLRISDILKLTWNDISGSGFMLVEQKQASPEKLHSIKDFSI